LYIFCVHASPIRVAAHGQIPMSEESAVGSRAQSTTGPVPAPAATTLVTGAGRGIGRAVALDLAAGTSQRLLLASKTQSALRTAEACNEVRPGAARGFSWDLTRPDAAQGQVFDALAASPGPIGLVHAAGVLGPTGPFATCDIERWWSALELNLGSTVRLVREILPRLLQDRGGRIVLFAGGGAAYGYPRFSSYATAKVALVRFCETLAMEIGPAGPILTIVAPGANDTDMLAQVRAAGGLVKTTVSIEEPCRLIRRLLEEDTRGLHGRFVHVRDEWTSESAREYPEDFLKLRRVDGR
jgi:3-oxoacyl-[acyl-carrier protein] reductase